MIITLGTTPAIARSMVFDRVAIDAVNRAVSVHVSAAGKSVNTARVIKTLGGDCTCTGFVGGKTGQQLCALLDASGIAHQFVEVLSPTRVCVTVINRANGTATELIEEAGEVRPGEVKALIEHLSSLALTCTTLLCCGSLARGLTPDFYAQAARLVRNKNPNARIIVDASGAALASTLGERAVVKCNRTELAACLIREINDDAAMIAALLELITRGAKMAVISSGAGATWVCDGVTIWAIESLRVKVISAIGSGDAMAAGLTVGLERGLDFIDAAKLAVACGAANAQTASPGDVNAQEVERLAAGLTVRKIA